MRETREKPAAIAAPFNNALQWTLTLSGLVHVRFAHKHKTSQSRPGGRAVRSIELGR